MKKLTIVLMALIVSATTQIQAQTADEIISNYFENIGGAENFGKLQGLKISASINQQGMVIPIEIVQLMSFAGCTFRRTPNNLIIRSEN